MKNEKILEYVKRIESLEVKEVVDLELRLQDLVHNEKNNKTNELISESKKLLNSQERYSLEASVQRAVTSIFVSRNEELDERVSLVLIPVAPIWNKQPEVVGEFFENLFVDIDKLLKKYKIIPKESTAYTLPNWLSPSQLESANYAEISTFLKRFLDTEDLLNLKLSDKFKYEDGDLLYIPLLIIESVYDEGFSSRLANLENHMLSSLLEEISNALSDDDFMVDINPILEFHEAIAHFKSYIFIDVIMMHLEEAYAMKIKMKQLFLIKENDKISLTVNDENNNELYHFVMESNSERILVEILETALYTLQLENQVHVVQSDETVIKMAYIGNLS